MPIDITMPALSPTMKEGNLVKWLVNEGDKVSPGDVIAEIETDKAMIEVEAVDEGTVVKIVVPAGTEGVKVSSLIAILAGEGEDASAAANGGNSIPVATHKAEAPKVGVTHAAAPPPVAVAAQDIKPAVANGATTSSKGRPFASPLARRIAKDVGVDIAAVVGTGPHGRIVKADVEAAIASGVTQAVPAAKAPANAPAIAPAIKVISDDQVLELFEYGSYELIPHDNMRKTIACRLVKAKDTVPHFYLMLECAIDALLTLRAQLNASAPTVKVEDSDVPAYKLSVNDMIIKAMALALKAVPDTNVSWTDQAMVKHKHADVGVAVSIPGGLITPIIRKADIKTLSVISNEMKDLAIRARHRKLKPEEYNGGTSAISNLGMFGIKNFAAIINPPHTTILAVGAGNKQAVVKNGEIKIANVMSVTLSIDHRAIDGAIGAELLAAFKRYIENPMVMLV